MRCWDPSAAVCSSELDWRGGLSAGAASPSGPCLRTAPSHPTVQIPELVPRLWHFFTERL
jgi:hypothetical protein